MKGPPLRKLQIVPPLLRAFKPRGCRDWRVLREDFRAWITASATERDAAELDPDEVPPAGMPRTLRFRAYTGRGRTRRDLRRLVTEFGSCRIDEALRGLGYLSSDGTPTP